MIPARATPESLRQVSSLALKSLALLRKLEWRVRHAADSVLSGDYRTAFRGRGMEFDQVIRYEYGDDVRDIDWNVTARLGQPYRKKYVEERELTLVLVVEDSPTLLFGSGQRSKREALLEMACLFALLAGINRDRLALVYVNGAQSWHHKPLRGRGPILHAMAQLLSQPEPTLAVNQSPVSSEIPWKLVQHLAPRHSLLIWLGDFPPRSSPNFWSALQKHYNCVGVRVTDPWEKNYPAGEALSAFDPASGDFIHIHPSSREFRRRQQQWNQQRDSHWGTLFPNPTKRLEISPSDDGIHALCSFLKQFKKKLS